MLKLITDFQTDLDRIARVKAVPTILQVVCRTTGMGFAAVARVTDGHWIACSVLDEISFGLKVGGELRLETTICHEIRQSETRQPVVIDDVAKDASYCNHATPALYGFQSYISVPIVLADGSMFGTLCAIDPRPARLNTPEVIGMFELFADLIAKHMDADQKLAFTENALSKEVAMGELREQFIGILGHDLRTPMRAITSFSQLLLRDSKWPTIQAFNRRPAPSGLSAPRVTIARIRVLASLERRVPGGESNKGRESAVGRSSASSAGGLY